MRPCDQGKTWIARRKPLCRQRQCAKEQKSISKMQAQKESVYCRSFQTANVIEQNQKGTKESFIEQKHACGNGRIARPIAFCGATPAAKQEDSYEYERQSARYSVREFDYCLDLRSRWQNLAVAEWPMTAASCA
jgi:tRNA A37 threonylcarbamoyladenosine modification protein TsaB